MSRTSPVSERAAELIDYIEQSTPPTYMDDVMFDRADRELIIAALRSFYVAQTPARPVSFMEAMDVVESGFNTWKDKPHNKKWFNRIDGTPIPNDLMVNIAEAISHSSLSSRAASAQCSQDRNETLRGLAAFFSESVHHVWDKDEIADCLTNMISADTSTDRGGE